MIQSNPMNDVNFSFERQPVDYTNDKVTYMNQIYYDIFSTFFEKNGFRIEKIKYDNNCIDNITLTIMKIEHLKCYSSNHELYNTRAYELAKEAKETQLYKSVTISERLKYIYWEILRKIEIHDCAWKTPSYTKVSVTVNQYVPKSVMKHIEDSTTCMDQPTCGDFTTYLEPSHYKTFSSFFEKCGFEISGIIYGDNSIESIKLTVMKKIEKIKIMR